MEEAIKVLVVEGQELIRKAIINLLSDTKKINVIGEAKNGREAVRLVEKLSPQVVLLDLKLPDINGLEVTREIRKSKPETKLLILTAYNDDIYPSRLLYAGALGYLTKEADIEELLHAIKVVASGER